MLHGRELRRELRVPLHLFFRCTFVFSRKRLKSASKGFCVNPGSLSGGLFDLQLSPNALEIRFETLDSPVVQAEDLLRASLGRPENLLCPHLRR